MGSKVSSGKMAAAARVVQVVRPHAPLIKFPNRQGLAKPNVQEALKLFVADVQQSPAPPPAHAASTVTRATGRLPGTPDTVATVKDLPQKYRRRALVLEEMDYIQRGGPE